MTGIKHILSLFRHKGIAVSLDTQRENLSLKGNIGALTPAEREWLVHHKPELIALLRAQQAARQTIPVHTDGGNCFPLAPGQQRIWVHETMGAAATAYTIPALYSYHIRDFDRVLFSAAIAQLSDRHEALRTIITMVDGRPMQEVLPGLTLHKHLEYIPIPAADAAFLQTAVTARMATPLSLSQRPPWHLTVFAAAGHQYHFFFRIHHLIADGESLNIMMKAVLANYEAQQRQETLPAAEQTRFRDYVHWINNREQFAASKIFWQQQFKGFDDTFDLPAGLADTANGGQACTMVLPTALRQRISSCLSGLQVHLPAFFTAAYGILLGRIARCSDFAIGIPAASRNHPQLQTLVGNLVNTLPLRIRIDHQQSPQAFIKDLQERYYAVLDHQLYPFDYILDDIDYPHQPGRFPLFSAMLSFPNNSFGKKEETTVTLHRNYSLYDLTCTVVETENDITLVMEYAAAKYSHTCAQQLTAAMVTLLDQLAAQEAPSLRALHLLPRAAADALIAGFSRPPGQSTRAFPTILHALEQQVAAHPERVALRAADTIISYGDVAVLLRQWVGALQQRGLQPGDPVLVQLPPSALQTLLGWAIMAGGFVYVPVDTGLPAQRREQVVGDCNPALVVDEAMLAELRAVAEGMEATVFAGAAPGAVAYLLYTSGTTGTPKAVAVTHQSLAQKMAEEALLVNQGSAIVTFALTSTAFDVSFLEWVLPLTMGGSVVLPRPEVLQEVEAMAAGICDNGVTVLQGTPTFFAHFFAQPLPGIRSSALQLLCIGGESLQAALLQRIKDVLPDVQVNNHYGPTEATIDAVVYRDVRTVQQNCIGRPMGDTTAFVVDECCQLLPPGATGELLLGGPALAQGYWNRPALTAAQFIGVHFTGERLYKTGDLVQWAADGTLIFHGRADRQLKYNGYRIEPEDINAALCSIAGVTQAYTRLFNKALVSWVAAKDTTGTLLREALADKLPHYMVPVVVVVDRLPETAAGKVDEQRLPAPGLYTAKTKPSGEPAVQLSEIWKSVLGVEEVYLQDNFFVAGGHSLRAINLLARVYQATGTRISIGTFFAHPTLEGLVDLIQTGAQQSFAPIPPAPQAAHYPLSPAQQRVWLASQFADNALAHHMPQAFTIRQPVDGAVLAKAINGLLERHEILRTVFRVDAEGLPYQYILPPHLLPPVFSILQDEQLDEATVKPIIAAETHKPFDLVNGPLLRILLIHGHHGAQWLSVVVHHIISDFSSDKVFRQELVHIYTALAAGQQHRLPPLAIQYRDYAVWANTALAGIAEEERLFWKTNLHHPLPHTHLPFDHPLPPDHDYSGTQYPVVLPADTAARLLRMTSAAQCSPFAVMLAALGLTLHHYTGDTDMVIGTPVSGKTHPDLDGQLGLYLNMLALRLTIHPRQPVAEWLAGIQQCCNAAFSHTLYPFERVLNELAAGGQQPSLLDTVINMVTDTGTPDAGGEHAVLALTPYDTGYTKSKFPLCLFVYQQGTQLSVLLEYQSARYAAPAVESFARRFAVVLTALLADPAAITGQLGWTGRPRLPPLPPANGKPAPRIQYPAQWPCTRHQERLWFIDRFEKDNLYKGSPVYHNLPLLVQLPAGTDPDLLESAIRQTLSQYPVLSTVVRDKDGLPVQCLTGADAPLLVRHSLSCSTEGIPAFCVAQLARPFDLAHDPLLRWDHLCTIAGNTYLLITAHHLVADRASLQYLWESIAGHIAGGNTGTQGEVNDFARFAEWQNTVTDTDWEPFTLYWSKKLRQLQVLYLDTDEPRAAIHLYEYAMESLALTGPQAIAVRQYCAAANMAPAVFFQAIFSVLLHRYTGLEDIVTGWMVDPRYAENGYPGVGPVSNLVALKNRISGADSWAAVLQQVNDEMRQSLDFSAIPFETVVLAVRPENDMSRTALFDVLFQYEQEWITPGGAAVVELNHGLGKYDLNLLVKEERGGFCFYLTNNRLYYTPARIRRLLGHLETLVGAVLDAPSTPVSTLHYLTDGERTALLMAGAVPDTVWPNDKTLVQLFEEQVIRTPGHTAVVYGPNRLSYAELNAVVNQLAYHLMEIDAVKRNEGIAVLLEKSEWMVVALLAVLKTGAGYVPVDPAYPEDRIRFMLHDSQCRIVIDNDLLDRFRTQQHQYAVSNPPGCNVPGDLAYIIYTSGSTGVPKGTLVEHRNLTRLFKTQPSLFDFGDTDGWLLFHSFCFDFSVWEMYGALLFGGKLVVLNRQVATDPEALLSLMQTERITVLNQTPSAFYTLAAVACAAGMDLPLRYVIFGGEALAPANLSAWHQRYPDTALVNMYGITETTVHVTFKRITAAEITSGVSNIGKPIPTLYTCILDRYLQLLPAGITGELCVGGEGVARGYLNQPELTTARFISDPFRPGQRLYRSGDKARLLDNGEMVYAGRTDDQVKIRGYRIEPGEIAKVLEGYAGVRQAIVLPYQQPGKATELRAYLAAPALTDIAAIRQFLGSRLPAYMVPARFIMLPELPLTANGKTDKQALLDMQVLPAGKTGELPVTNTEKVLARCWAALLQKTTVYRDDHFFHLGGHSLTAVQLQLQIKSHWQIACKISMIFIHPILRDLAAAIDEETVLSAGEVQAIPLLPEQRYYKASFAQQRLWFLEQFSKTAYLVDISVQLRGEVDSEKLRSALEQLIQRHEILRTHFIQTDGLCQVIREQPAAGWFEPLVLPPAADVQGIIREKMSTPFDLENGPLFKAVLLYTGEQEAVLLLLFHHIIIDDWSARLLIHELMTCYAGRAGSLPALRIQYKEYAHWKTGLRHTPAYETAKQYWLKQFSLPCPPLELPVNGSRPRHKTYHGHTLLHEITGDAAAAIRQCARDRDVTLPSLLLGCFSLLLYRYTGQQDMVIGIPVSDRDHPDLHHQAGLYQHTLPIRIMLNRDDSLGQLIRQVHHTVIDGFDHQLFPFDELVEALALPRDLSRTPLFDVMFTHQLLAILAPESITDSGITITPLAFHPPVSKFDLMLNVAEGPVDIALSLSYNTDLFGEALTKRLLDQFVALTAVVLSTPDQLIRATGIPLPAGHVFPGRALAATPIVPITSQWQQALAQWPDVPALRSDTRRFTLAELHEAAVSIACRLQQTYGCTANDRIGVYCNRTEDYVLMQVAIFRMGACYLPIDPQLPAQRRDFIIAEAAPRYIITDDETDGVQGAVTVNINELLSGISNGVVQEHTAPETDAFALYTSGTTGTPKGILQTYRTIANLIGWERETITALPGSRYLQFAAISFDVSVQDIAFALASGLTLCIPPPHIRKDIAALYDFILAERITILSLPFAVLRAFVAATGSLKLEALRLQHIITYGEQLVMPPELAAYLAANPEVQLHNHYGPTETHVVTAHTCNGRQGLPGTWQPIGLPIANNQAWVLDEDFQEVPPGATGMLCISGANLFNRYIDPAIPLHKTTRIAVADGQELFCTGDQVRYTAEGVLQYMGRKDQQVKINGNRVEPGEIEQVLARHAAIREVIVLAIKTAAAGYALHAVYTVHTAIAPIALSNWCKQFLPVFMVPVVYTPVEVLPLNKNGKIDRAQVMLLTETALPDTGEMVMPVSLPGLQAVWSDLLNHPITAPATDFFTAGGHSLTATVLLNRIREQFNCAMTIEDIFGHPVLLDMAAFIDAAPYALYERIPVQPATASDPLSPAQLSFWLKIQHGNGREADTISALAELHGEPDPALLETAVQAMVDRHDILRTLFRVVDGVPRQVVLSATKTRFSLHTGDRYADDGFDPGQWPLFSINLCKTGTGVYTFFISMHHLISDGWTLELFIGELVKQYARLQTGNTPALQPLQRQYRDYACWMHEWCKGPEFTAAAGYWRNQLSGVYPQQAFAGLRLTETFTDPAGTNLVFQLCRDEHITLFLEQQRMSMYAYLVAVMFLLKYRYGRQPDLLLAGVSAGRVHQDLEQMMGYFLNTYYLRIVFDGNATISGYCQQVKKMVIGALQHQRYPFDEVLGFLGEAKRLLQERTLHETGMTYQRSRYTEPDNEPVLPLRATPVPAPVQRVKDPLWWYFTDDGEQVTMDIHFATAVYDAAAIRQLAEDFCRLATTLAAADPALPAGEYLIANTAGAGDQHQQRLHAATQVVDDDF